MVYWTTIINYNYPCMKILVNAYACSPNMGSEPGMAWNWCVHLAKHCELYIITEGEFRDRIDAVVPTLPQGGNMHFFYNPIGGEDAPYKGWAESLGNPLFLWNVVKECARW